MAMILDNNLGGDLENAKELLRAIAPLKFWAIGTQFSIECLRDDEFVDLLAKARCRMAFIGMESLNEKSLAGVRKRQNRVEEYRELFAKLHDRGILTFAGLMLAMEGDTMAYYASLPQRLAEIDVSAILPSISIPLYGTPWYVQAEAEGRILDHDLSHHEGDHVVFRHPNLPDEDIYAAYRFVTGEFYRWSSILQRWWKFLRRQKKTEPLGGFLLKLLVTTFVYFEISWFQKHHTSHRIQKPLARAPAARPARAAMSA
jgi:radical SAM superfamily enzyme YgiQ (UPF0313 family)